MGCLYQITSPSGKSYIGITNFTAQERWSQHVGEALGSRSKRAISNAIRKYSSDLFDVKTLLIANDAAYLKLMEVKVIAAFKTHTPNGYNMTAGGDGVVDLDSETFKNLLEKRLKTIRSKVYRKKNSETQKALWTEEKRKERSRVVSELWEDENYRNHMSEVHKGWHYSKREREKASIRSKKRWSNPEYVKRHKLMMKKLWQDDEFKKKMAEATTDEVKKKIGVASRKMWSDPEFHAKRSKQMKEYFNLPEVKEKIAEKTRQQMADPEARKKIGEAMCKHRGYIFSKGIKPKNPRSVFYKIWDKIESKITFAELYRFDIESRRISEAVDRGYLVIVK